MKRIAQGLTALSLLLVPASTDAAITNYFAFTGYACQAMGPGFIQPDRTRFICPGASVGSAVNGATIDRANVRITDYSTGYGIRVQACFEVATGWGTGGCGHPEESSRPFVGTFQQLLRVPTGGTSAHVPYIHFEAMVPSSRVWTYSFEDCTAPDLYCP